jgi:hypothetical protein
MNTAPRPHGFAFFSYLSALACYAALGSVTLHAGSVTLSTSRGSAFTSSSGVRLASGALVRIGTFTFAEATRDATIASTKDYSALNAAFKPLAESNGAAGTPSQLNGSGNQLIVNNYPATGDVFGSITNVSTSYIPQGAQLYLWVFDAGSASTSTQWGIFKSSNWLAPAELGAVTLSTTGSITALQGSIASGEIRLATPVATIGNWNLQNFPAGAAASMTAYNADPDGDGLSNLAEYAWKLSPTGKSTGRASLSANATAATFNFKAPRSQPNVNVTAECSSDLKTWSTATSTITASDEDFDTHTCTVAAGASSCFWRVRFTAVP